MTEQKVTVDWKDKILYFPRGWNGDQIYWSYMDILDADMTLSDIGGPYVSRSEPIHKVYKTGKKEVGGIYVFTFGRFEFYEPAIVYSPNPDWEFRYTGGE